jgi:hypothetical protein
MSAEQWESWLGVLRTALSEGGLRKVETIMSLEREVRERDGRTWVGSLLGGVAQGEQRYYVSLFGEPRAGSAWGARFDGHHVSLNWTVTADGAFTPLFLGAEPREVPEGAPRAGLRALAEEEDRASALVATLDPLRRARAELELTYYASGPGLWNRPLFLGEGERVDPAAPQGISRAELLPVQQALLDGLIDTFLANYGRELAGAWRSTRRGRDAIHFAFAGSLVRGEPGYYRVQGPTFLIEFDNTAREADHVHTILREFDGDFGRDLLADHYERAHAPALAGRRGAKPRAALGSAAEGAQCGDPRLDGGMGAEEPRERPAAAPLDAEGRHRLGELALRGARQAL